MMDREDTVRVLSDALRDFGNARDDLGRTLVPNGPPPPQVRRRGDVKLAPHVILSIHQPGGSWIVAYLCRDGRQPDSRNILDTAAKLAELPTPRDILRALRRIQAATAWCRARREGQRRAMEEVERQQAQAVEALEAEIVAHTLGGGA